MKVTELRIGNYIKTDDKEFIPVSIKEITDLFEDPADDYYGDILLTEEWFIKFNFTHVKYEKVNYFVLEPDNIYAEYRFHLKDNICHVSVGDNEMGITITIIKFVHQLQNLFFSITGKELIIK